jgi:hypothetical protein
MYVQPFRGLRGGDPIRHGPILRMERTPRYWLFPGRIVLTSGHSWKGPLVSKAASSRFPPLPTGRSGNRPPMTPSAKSPGRANRAATRPAPKPGRTAEIVSQSAES